MSFFDDVRKMHVKFELDTQGQTPSSLTKEEYLFRIGAMFEEVWEYVYSIFDFDKIEDENDVNANAFREAIIDILSELELRKDVGSPKRLAEQLDALVDLAVFTCGTAERQAFPFNKAWERVMDANMQKELAGTNENSKRGFKRDLVKPEGWKKPNIISLVSPPNGIIVLEGPDGTGKTTLAEELQDIYGAKVIHATWSPELEKDMENYHLGIINEALSCCKDRLVVLDRSWISEFIYSEVYRNGTNYPNLADKAFNLLQEAKTLYVFCLPNFKKEYLASFEQLKLEREEMYSEADILYDAFSSFVYGEFAHEPAYVFNQKEGKCNFLNENPCFPFDDSVKCCVFSRFSDAGLQRDVKTLIHNYAMEHKYEE